MFIGRAEACLGEFLKEIKAERMRDVRFQDMTNIIVVHAKDESSEFWCSRIFTKCMMLKLYYFRANYSANCFAVDENIP